MEPPSAADPGPSSPDVAPPAVPRGRTSILAYVPPADPFVSTPGLTASVAPPPPAPAAGLANGASLDGTTSTSGLTGISHPPAFVMSNGTPGPDGKSG